MKTIGKVILLLGMLWKITVHAVCPGGVCPISKVKVNDVSPVEIITAEQLKEKIQHGGAHIKIVNVLGQRFCDDAKISDARSVCAPYDNLEEIAKNWDRNQEIIVYCACYECDASLKAARLLKAMGFTKVVDYKGGMREWFQLGQQDPSYKTEGPQQQEYLKASKERLLKIHEGYRKKEDAKEAQKKMLEQKSAAVTNLSTLIALQGTPLAINFFKQERC